MPSRCECGHNQQRHEMAGFDGECVADGCRCKKFRPVEQAVAAARAPLGRPPQQAVTVERLLAVAHASGDKRCVLLAAKIGHELQEIRARLAALRAKASADAIQARLAQVPGHSARPSGPRPVVEVPCSREGCGRVFASSQGRALHERRAHDGFDPNAAKAG
jgi:hypothetical protein